ncbi:gamma-butyrobetaine hydroxylase-like domain-containing protein [Ideonella sp.]|uniref:gamma-butyrobetaine hydroxylase-like domain-containing protein n=1 Tax=Ideonella sp. TaxID=1929293 RepID=UPI003BB63E3D
MSKTPEPVALTVHQASKVLEIGFADGQTFRIPFELMRVCSPSAEVQGHGPGQEVLQTGKRGVSISGVAPIGNYGIQPTFDDGHESGIFTWVYLYELGSKQAELWAQYEARLQAAGVDRDAPMPPKAGSACASH